MWDRELSDRGNLTYGKRIGFMMSTLSIGRSFKFYHQGFDCAAPGCDEE